MMNTWDFMILASLVATAGAGVFYAMAAKAAGGRGPLALSSSRRKGVSRDITYGRALMALSFVTLVIASVGLLSMLLRHDFRFEYVVNNSERGLEGIYLVSAFWAGQEGSLLLWGLFSALFGCLLALTSKDEEPYAMPWYALTQAALLLISFRMSPFRMLDTAASEGMGLNPLLRNPWMAIHPPIVFAGYAAIAAPYALAMGALTKKDYKGWVAAGTWWNLLAWLLLGSGIMIGARWAYAVLGWGGYWGWDPVENASLVPWISGMALLHTFLSQKARGKMVRTNIALAIVTYLLIGYGTFLTRSGVLSDFSVHSFADLGISSYLLLLLAVIGLPAIVLYVVRFKDMTVSRKYEEIYEKWTSRDFGIFSGASILLAAGLVTLLGTSAPLLTGIFGESQAVDTNFYNVTNYPLAVLVAIVMGMFPVFRWGTDELKSARGGLLASLVLAIVGTIAIIVAGGSGAVYLIFMFVSLFGLFTNLYMLVRTIRNGIKHIGSYATHLGVSLVFAGIIATGGWAVTERVMIPIGGAAETAGLTIEASAPRTSTDGSTVYVPLKLYKDGKLFQEGEPYMQKTKMDSTLRHPMIHSTLTEDIYISPLTLSGSTAGMSTMGGTELEVKKGGSVSAEGLTISFLAFDISGMNEGKVGADIKVSETGKTLYEGKIYMSVAVANVEGSSVIIDGSSGEFSLSMSGIDASSGMIYLNLAKASETTTTSAGSFLVEVSRKPFVSLLWIGACLIVAGTAIALVKRLMEAR